MKYAVGFEEGTMYEVGKLYPVSRVYEVEIVSVSGFGVHSEVLDLKVELFK